MEIMYRMTTEKNAKSVMNEFYEYHKNLNTDFVKISVNYIAKICLRINQETPYGIELYSKVIEGMAENTGADIIDAITIGCVKIMRVFPKVKGGTQMVKLISKRFKELYSPEAKASYVWLLGEYCKRIDNAGPILEHFTKSYFSQPSDVQLRILNSGIKMYLYQIEPIDSVMSELIQSISDNSTNPDLRDRGYIYWRILYKDDEKAKDIIFNEPQAVEVDCSFSPKEIEDAKNSLKHGGRISGILKRNPEELFKDKQTINRGKVDLDAEVIIENKEPVKAEDSPPKSTPVETFDILDGPVEEAPKPVPAKTKSPSEPVKSPPKKGLPAPGSKAGSKAATKAAPQTEMNLLDMDPTESPALTPNTSNQNNADLLSGNVAAPEQEENLFDDEENGEEDLFEGAPSDNVEIKFISMPEETLVKKETKGKNGNTGITVMGNFKKDSQLAPLQLHLNIRNNSSTVLDQLTFQFKANYFGLKAQKPSTVPSISPGDSSDILLTVDTNTQASQNLKEALVFPYTIQTAFKSTLDTYFFKVPIQMNHLLEPRGELSKSDFKTSWASAACSKVFPRAPLPPLASNLEALCRLLRENNLFVIQKKREGSQTLLYISCRLSTGQLAFLNLALLQGEGMDVEVRGEEAAAFEGLYQGTVYLLK